MPKNKPENTVKKTKDVYTFPAQGVSVKASSLEEAYVELEKLLKPKDKQND